MMLQRARALVHQIFAPTILPSSIASPVFYQVLGYHKTQHQWLLRRLVSIALALRFELVTKERIVEVPFVLQHLAQGTGARVLEFGCYGSTLCIELASLGYQVTGVDLRHYPLQHPNFQFLRGNFLGLDIPHDSFDYVVAISAIEHAGLGAYQEHKIADGDRATIHRIQQILRPGGRLLMTVPFGKRELAPTYRVYDPKSLQEAIGKLNLVEVRYFMARENRSCWLPATADQLAEVDSVAEGWVKGVACVVCEK